MLVKEHKNILFDFLVEPSFKGWRHMIAIIMFSFISVGQSLFLFDNQTESLGNKIYWFGIANTIVIIAFLYFNLYMLIPRLLLKSCYIEYLIALLAGTIVYLIIKSIIESYIFSQIGIIRNFNAITLLDGFSNMVLYSICIASSSVTTLFKQWMTDTKRINDMEIDRLKRSVDEIKSHINAKSLSDVLSYASEKVKTSPEETSAVLFKLSKVLRYELYDCKREKILLESDIEFINEYLSLEQLNTRFTYRISASIPEKNSLFVPPFIFAPVIRKIIEQQPTDISINFDVHNGVLKFQGQVSGADLTICDFSKEKQRLYNFYRYDAKIDKNRESVELQLSL